MLEILMAEINEHQATNIKRATKFQNDPFRSYAVHGSGPNDRDEHGYFLLSRVS